MLKLGFLRHLTVALSLSLLAVSGASHAADDKQPTRIVVGFAPGGAADILARTLAEWLHEHTGKTYIVENRQGASARIAVEYVKRAAPDGKTVLITSPSPITVFPLTYTPQQLRYDPDVDLAPVAHLVDAPQAFFVRADSPLKSMAEYIESIKQQPEEASVGLVTLGSPTHFALMALADSIDVPLVPVPYSGVSPMLTDIIGGVLPAGINPIGGQLELAKTGKIRFLGVTGTERTGLLPELPTMKEAGAEGFEMASGWFAAYAPAGTPQDVIDELEDAFIAATKDPAVRDKLGALALEATGWPAEKLREYVTDQRDYWAPIIKASGFTAND